MPTDRLVLVVTSPRLPAGLLSWQGWQALRSGPVLSADPESAQARAVRAAGVPVGWLVADDDRALATAFRDQARAGHAAVCSYLARELKICDHNQAYTFGLFRDAGMPAMLNKKKASYEDILDGTAFNGTAPITAIENERYGLTHAQVGAYFGTSWHLDESVWKAILLHHDYDKWPGRARELAVRTAALGLLSEEIFERHDRNRSCAEWHLGGATVLAVLHIDEDRVEDLRVDVSQALEG